MNILTWFDEKTAACEQRATQVDDQLKFVYLDAARDNREARATVAELIERERVMREALRRIADGEHREGATDGQIVSQMMQTADAALARVGGAK